MKVYIYQNIPDFDTSARIIKVFDTREKAEDWHKRMLESIESVEKYLQDGKDFLGEIIEMEVE